jgi:nucleoside-diphosphate-sugar epimerase
MAKQLPTVLILGANGHLGRAATDAFAQAGWRVFAAARSKSASGSMRDSKAIVRITAGIESPEEIVAQAQGARVVLYSANPLYTQWPGHALPMAQMGARIARELGASFLFPGNVYNFGEAMPNLLTENTPKLAQTRKGLIRIDMESTLAIEAERGLRTVVLRAGDFFGPNSGSWFDRVIAKSIARGKIVYPGPLDREHAWAYLPDLARAFVALAARECEAGTQRSGIESFGFAGHTLTGETLLAATETAYRNRFDNDTKPLERSQTPWSFYRFLSPLVPTLREIVEMEYLWRVPHRIDGSALGAAIGTIPETSLSDALPASIEPLFSKP